MTAPSPPFVILGGGPCGLAAAWALARKGVRPIVFEREPLVGGLCATHEWGGFRFDLGGHRFVSSDADLSRWLEELLGDDLLTQERRSVVLHAGRRFRYPLDAKDLLANLGIRENARALAGYAAAQVARLAKPSRDASFEDWVVARFGRPLYDTFFGPYTEKLWGIAPSAISADWAAERISLLDLGDAALRMAGLRNSPIRTYARRYRYPRLGMGQLYETIAKDIARHGGEVHTSARVVGLDVERGVGAPRVVAVNVTTPRGSLRVPVGELFSTIPLPELVRALLPHAHAAIDRAARALAFRALVFVNVPLARANFSENTWMYVASPELRTSRIQEPKRRSAAMAPRGHTSLMLEVPCDAGDRLWNAGDDELAHLAAHELGALGFSMHDAIGRFSVRVEHGYPVYHLAYERDRQALLAEVARFANVRTAGRQGLFRYVFMDAAMQMGLRAAEQMLVARAGGARDEAAAASQGALDALGRSARVLELSALTA
jgi:protoporphyrinogen oxidase